MCCGGMRRALISASRSSPFMSTNRPLLSNCGCTITSTSASVFCRMAAVSCASPKYLVRARDRKSTRLNSSHSLHDALPIYQPPAIVKLRMYHHLDVGICVLQDGGGVLRIAEIFGPRKRSEEHTSELQSLPTRRSSDLPTARYCQTADVPSPRRRHLCFAGWRRCPAHRRNIWSAQDRAYIAVCCSRIERLALPLFAGLTTKTMEDRSCG